LSASQIATFTAIYNGNNRDAQPLNARELVWDGDVSN
jgi:carbonic anhydrase